MSRLDKSLLLAIFALLGIGLVQVYSSSFIFAIESRGDGLFFFKRQLVFAIFAILLLFAVALLPHRWIRGWGFLLWIAGGIGVAFTLVPGFAIRAGGSARWLALPGGFVFEPSELLKVSLPVMLAFLATRLQGASRALWILAFVALALPMAIVLKQPDFGTFVIVSAVLLTSLFAFGLKWRYIVCTLVAAAPAFYFLIMNSPYRRARILGYLDPWSDPRQKGFQIIQSMLSFQSGGLTGSGMGQGQGKLFFLPEAHTDFTLAVLGEEMGFFGVLLVLALYGFVVFRGLQITSRAEETFSRAAALGLTVTFALSVFINVGVVTGFLPTKGLTMPFLSYGGSSLLMTGLLFGLLLNIDRQERAEEPFGRTSAGLFRRAR